MSKRSGFFGAAVEYPAVVVEFVSETIAEESSFFPFGLISFLCKVSKVEELL